MECATDQGKNHACLDLAMAASGAKDRKGKARVHFQLHLLDDGDHLYNGLGGDQQFQQQQAGLSWGSPRLRQLAWN